MCVDGAPTIYCFHSSCASVVAEACRTLRRAIGQSPWAIRLPGGRLLRNGDVLQQDGTVKTRAEILGHTSSGLRPHVRVGVQAGKFSAEQYEL